MSETTYEHCRGFVEAGEPMEVYVKGRSEELRIREALAIPELGKRCRGRRCAGPRVEVDLPLQYHAVSGKAVEPLARTGRLHDAGYHGALAEFEAPLPAYSEIKLAFDLPGLNRRAQDIYARLSPSASATDAIWSDSSSPRSPRTPPGRFVFSSRCASRTRTSEGLALCGERDDLVPRTFAPKVSAANSPRARTGREVAVARINELQRGAGAAHSTSSGLRAPERSIGMPSASGTCATPAPAAAAVATPSSEVRPRLPRGEAHAFALLLEAPVDGAVGGLGDVAHAVVALEIGDAARHAALGQVGGRGAREPVHLHQLACDERRIGRQVHAAQRTVEAFGDEVDRAVVHEDLDLELRIARKEARQRGHEGLVHERCGVATRSRPRGEVRELESESAVSARSPRMRTHAS